MSTPLIAGIAAAAVLVAVVLAALLARKSRRTAHLRDRFGPEYERTVEQDGRRHGERELLEREERHDSLELRPLPAAARERYEREWTATQASFVDTPESAVTDAHRLVTSLMADRGYPTEDLDDRIALLSVEHADVIQHYRKATEIEETNRTGRATTEQLRRSMVHFRTLFERLLASADEPVDPYADEPVDPYADEPAAPARETDRR